MSACLPNIYGVYMQNGKFIQIYFCFYSTGFSRKGRLTLCRKLVEPIHKALREQNRAEFEAYQRDLTESRSRQKRQNKHGKSRRSHRLKCW